MNWNFSNPVSIVPCLANLQIWGKLSQSVNEVKRKEIDSIWLALNKAKRNPIQINNSEVQAHISRNKGFNLKKMGSFQNSNISKYIS